MRVEEGAVDDRVAVLVEESVVEATEKEGVREVGRAAFDPVVDVVAVAVATRVIARAFEYEISPA